MAMHIAPDITLDNKCSVCEGILCTGTRLIFTALVFLSKEDEIETFYRCSREDTICDSNILRGDSGLPAFTKSWTTRDKELFFELQWQMRSPYFKSYTLSDNARPVPDNEGNPQWTEFRNEVTLPWTKLDSPEDTMEDPGIGANKQQGLVSEIKRVEIHPDHHELGQISKAFALKIIKAGPILSDPTFKREIFANRRLGGPHNHIVPLLAAFKHRGLPCLLLPWADGGSLEDLWKTKEPIRGPGRYYPICFSQYWVQEQCRGIADGLAWIHGPHQPASNQVGWQPQIHLDIKPENILAFPEIHGGETSYYKLKLADFGLSQTVQKDGNIPTETIRHTLTYRPPEKDLGEKNASPQWDVWCLGCLYLEFITWFLLNYSHLEAFRLKREERTTARLFEAKVVEDTFFSKRALVSRIRGIKPRQKGKIKKTVISHIKELQCNEECDTALNCFLSYVKEHMLAIESKLLYQFGAQLLWRYDRARKAANLANAIRALQEASDSVVTSEAEENRRANSLGSLGTALFTRYRTTRDLGDLEEAIRIARDSIRMTRKDNLNNPIQSNNLSIGLKNIGFMLEERFMRLGDMSDLEDAIATHAALHLIPTMMLQSLENSDKQELIGQNSSLASDAAAVALNAGASPHACLRLLEQGRDVLAESLHRLRTDSFSLRAKHPDLEAKYTLLCQELDLPGFAGLETELLSWEARASRRYAASRELNLLLTEIREQPGF
ncbi:kinase-like protein [Thozetella sp. PMI_491]|nr:kinase-like protein [Thozetella sp. PMI_491]